MQCHFEIKIPIQKNSYIFIVRKLKLKKKIAE